MKEKASTLKTILHRSNVGEDLRSAMDQLRRDHSIVIRQADKGSCIVAIDTAQYIAEGLHHLSDTSIYKKLDRDRILEVTHKANWAVRHHASIKMIDRLQEGCVHKQPDQTRTEEMYFLRKVHKTPHKIRPIVSCSSGPTEKISGFVCDLLQPHLADVRSLVTNSQEVIQVIEAMDLSEHPQVTLVSLDVESLYLSIPQGAGIEMVLQRVFPTTPPHSTQHPHKNLARDLLKVIIRDNVFRFHDNYFQQTRGVAMGTRCASPFANLFLGSLEEKALSQWTGTHPLLWLCFLDDILMLWTGNQNAC